MSKGFTIDPDLRDERDAVCVDYESTMQWAMTSRPGAVPVLGGRKRRIAHFHRTAYARYGRHNKLGRFTPPREGVFPAPAPSEKVLERRERIRAWAKAAGMHAEGE